MSKTDAELVCEALDGDGNSFKLIVERYQRLVFNIVYHYLGRPDEVEDIAQEVFLKVFRSLHTFDTSRPLQSWISRITSNTCLDELRKRRHRKTRSFADLSEEEEKRIKFIYEKAADSDHLTEEEANGAFGLLQVALDELPDKDRMAFVLREMEGLGYSEIAESLQTTELAARIRVSRARKKLQSKFQRLFSGSKPRVIG